MHLLQVIPGPPRRGIVSWDDAAEVQLDEPFSFSVQLWDKDTGGNACQEGCIELQDVQVQLAAGSRAAGVLHVVVASAAMHQGTLTCQAELQLAGGLDIEQH